MPNDYRFVSIRALDVLALNSFWMGNLSMVDILVKICYFYRRESFFSIKAAYLNYFNCASPSPLVRTPWFKIQRECYFHMLNQAQSLEWWGSKQRTLGYQESLWISLLSM